LGGLRVRAPDGRPRAQDPGHLDRRVRPRDRRDRPSDLRKIGGVTPPREFVFMDRAAVGLGSVFLHLKAEVNWHRLFNSLIEDFSTAALAKRQAAALEAAGVPLPE
jgi:hypothetical protein